jgi:hypothetical protein
VADAADRLRALADAATPGGDYNIRYVGNGVEILRATPPIARSDEQARLIALAPDLARGYADALDAIRQDARRRLDGYGLCWCPDTFYRKRDTKFVHLNGCTRNRKLLADADRLLGT